MSDSDGRAGAASGRWAGRLAGGLLLAVGVLNLGFGVLSLATDQVRLSVGAAGALIAAGLLIATLGALVWRGSRPATIGAFVLFTVLLLYQVSEVVADTAATPDGLAQAPGARFAVLGLLVVTSGIAAWQLRGRRPARAPR